jgi:hypothetical protein
MSQYVESACKSFVAGAAIAKCLRVKLSAGKLAVAGAEEHGPGTIETAVFADLDPAAVRLWTAQGTRKVVAAGPFAVGADIYGAAGGKVDDVSNSLYIGLALEAASADGDIVEAMCMPVLTQGS